jgi:hypothetical protein
MNSPQPAADVSAQPTRWQRFLHWAFDAHAFGPWSPGTHVQRQNYWTTKTGTTPIGAPYWVRKQIRTCIICGETDVRYLDV